MNPYALSLVVILFAALNLWVYYVAAMRLKMVQAQGKLTPAMQWFTYPVLAIGYALDFFVNVIACSILFLEPPFEWTVSARLYRLSTQDKDDWRKARALALRTGLLDEIDPDGIHKG